MCLYIYICIYGWILFVDIYLCMAIETALKKYNCLEIYATRNTIWGVEKKTNYKHKNLCFKKSLLPTRASGPVVMMLPGAPTSNDWPSVVA